ncbi:MAG: hypothetical protein V4488_09515 [Pseudomonadota bacterium]
MSYLALTLRVFAGIQSNFLFDMDGKNGEREKILESPKKTQKRKKLANAGECPLA